ncbi:uncharacterized protein MYCFIDRAFT_190109 [Pseudocercospora fijiensis CIRAD86]|uniref:Transcriptional coactivator MYCFIDRAFT_190109 n=1 Tax=Pseudocercospora fijiensis (strain CIRAD86) TaxID=383855 RepID=PK81J_PSEFD|nr:uncharacterized protein MYCFIDRAFT_190109 [Pseudocercospora fijiensis CIRAD86]M2YMT1.1 RecName: Full=Transcriptional coactivator MYCFIDRAFT_190109; AltName: Full=PKS8-1 gene cluster protein MYCFIDRAFT_190109 [Pseudocercospora fijiensis CIRAD86]EME79050.1 hypothetical protein MYCFIDRAFT_190109 [Pseudocercospora fijiensis CIRAD86]
MQGMALNQLLACLKWLGEFQVLACIPLKGSIHARDVADLTGVPETQLCRVVRLMATAGFLHEPRPGQIAHTVLSGAFVTDLSLLDAGMFLSETAAPVALHMATATERQSDLQASNSAYSVAFNTSQPFEAACVERSRLHRQWSAYSRCAGDAEDKTVELFGQLNWRSLGSATIVDSCAQSTDLVLELAKLYPSLHFVVQMNNAAAVQQEACRRPESEDVKRRMKIQERMPSAPQTVKDAAVYILRLPATLRPSAVQILAELRAHLGALRANSSATLILATPLLPEPGTLDPDSEARARVRDLARLQLTNETDLELSELIELVNGVHDSNGRFRVVSKLRSRDSAATAALGIKYQAVPTAP